MWGNDDDNEVVSMMYHQTASKKKKEGWMDGRTVGSDLEHDVVVENAHEFLGIVEQLVE